MLRLIVNLFKIFKSLIEDERRQMLHRGLYVNNETPKALGTRITWHK